MKHNKKRVSKIIDELITYLFSMEANNININVLDREEDYKILVESNYKKEYEDMLDKLIVALKSPKQEEIEEYYWELTGESDVGTEIYLVGMMIDKVDVFIDGNTIKMELYRNK